jgi:hypothetical protein
MTVPFIREVHDCLLKTLWNHVHHPLSTHWLHSSTEKVICQVYYYLCKRGDLRKGKLGEATSPLRFWAQSFVPLRGWSGCSKLPTRPGFLLRAGMTLKGQFMNCPYGRVGGGAPMLCSDSGRHMGLPLRNDGGEIATAFLMEGLAMT